MIKVTKKHLGNFGFVLLIALMIYPPTKIYFLRIFSFSPSVIVSENQMTLEKTDWQLKGLNTQDVNLNQLQGKVIFINFWATWCPPCIAEMPSMESLYDSYKDDVAFLFVGNESWETVSAFFLKKGYNFPVYTSQSVIPSILQSNSIPVTFIIDKELKVNVKKVGAADWDSDTVKNLLDKLIKKP